MNKTDLIIVFFLAYGFFWGVIVERYLPKPLEKYLKKINYKSKLFNKYKEFCDKKMWRDAYVCLWYCLRDDKEIQNMIKKYKLKGK